MLKEGNFLCLIKIRFYKLYLNFFPFIFLKTKNNFFYTCRVEAWDTRSRKRVATLDCAYSLSMSESNNEVDGKMLTSIPQVTSLAFRDGLNLGVGMSTGQILLYDIRSSKPLLVKDH